MQCHPTTATMAKTMVFSTTTIARTKAPSVHVPHIDPTPFFHWHTTRDVHSLSGLLDSFSTHARFGLRVLQYRDFVAFFRQREIAPFLKGAWTLPPRPSARVHVLRSSHPPHPRLEILLAGAHIRKAQCSQHGLLVASAKTAMGVTEAFNDVIVCIIDTPSPWHGEKPKSSGRTVRTPTATIELSSTSQTEINLPFISSGPSGPQHINQKLLRS